MYQEPVLLFSEKWSEMVRMTIEAGGSGSASLSVFPLRIPPSETGSVEIEIRNGGHQLLDSIKKDILIEVSIRRH